ncbi:MAG TPA: hypothetical protein VKG45_14750 [Actinomycetes bacterium]|nr:hypothetical protein [Actinomycetes bacterium]
MGDHLDRTSNEGLVYAARTDRCRQTGVTADDDVPGAEVPAQSAR